MGILSKGCKLDNFESQNSLKFSFKNIHGLCLNFVKCESFLESNSPDILALCGAKLDDSIRFWHFFDSKHSSTDMHGPAVYVKEGLPFAWDLSLENSTDSYLCFQLALFHSVQCLTSFLSIDHLLRLYAQFFIVFHLTQMRFSQSTHLLMCLSLETLTSIIRTAGFYPSTFVYSRFSPKIQFLYCLLSSVAPWGDPMVHTEGKGFEI